MLPTPLYEASLAFLGHGDLRIRCSAYKRFSPATEENRRKPRFSQLCYGSAADFETPNGPQNQSPSAFEPTPKADRFSRTPYSTASFWIARRLAATPFCLLKHSSTGGLQFAPAREQYRSLTRAARPSASRKALSSESSPTDQRRHCTTESP